MLKQQSYSRSDNPNLPVKKMMKNNLITIWHWGRKSVVGGDVYGRIRKLSRGGNSTGRRQLSSQYQLDKYCNR